MKQTLIHTYHGQYHCRHRLNNLLFSINNLVKELKQIVEQTLNDMRLLTMIALFI